MNRKRVIIFTSLALLAIFLMSMFVLGYIDLSLYKSNVISNQNSSIAYGGTLGSYEIEFVYRDKIVQRHNIIKNDEKTVDIYAEIEDFKYHGNYFFPIIKKFTMDYKCTFTEKNAETNQNTPKNIDGDIKGNIQAEIIGLCSPQKAKEIVEDKAITAIKEYIVTSLSK